jgi:hypothetical protein
MALSELLRDEPAFRGTDRPASSREVAELEAAVRIGGAETRRSRIRRCRPHLGAPHWRVRIGRGHQSTNRGCALDLLPTPSWEVETAAAKRTTATIAKSATPTTAWTGALAAAAVALGLDQCVACAGEDRGQQNDNRPFHAVRHFHTVFDVAEPATVVSNLLNAD